MLVPGRVDATVDVVLANQAIQTSGQSQTLGFIRFLTVKRRLRLVP